MATFYDPYFAASVTIPNDGANHQLFPLLVAIDPNCPIRSRFVTIQNDPTSADSLLIGSGPTNDQGLASSSVLTSTNYGFKLIVGANEPLWGTRDEDFALSRYWVRTTGVGTVKLNLQAIRG
jgi:hypothetical protein